MISLEHEFQDTGGSGICGKGHEAGGCVQARGCGGMDECVFTKGDPEFWY
jgi:hypothetical protein